MNNKRLLMLVRKIRRNFLIVKMALPLVNLITYRQSQQDLGRYAEFDSASKKGMNDLIITNLTRAKESSRIIEEIAKSQNLKIGNKMKAIRFQLYDLEKNIIESLKKIFEPRLCAILDERYLIKSQLAKMVHILESNGATMIQLRIKTLSSREFYDWARTIRNIITKLEIKFIINDRIDIALACGADGVHLGQDDISLKKAREILGDCYIIGASAHNKKEAREAEDDGADYIGVGAIFKTKTKPDAHVCGLKILKSICRMVNIPVIAIGGINDKNYKAVFKAGAAGIAVSSYLFEGDLKKNIHSLTIRRL